MPIHCCFIVSPSYSGSTLLSILLAHHPGLATLGEYLDNRERRYREGEGDFCSCGSRLAECPYMADLTSRLQAKGMEFSVDFPDTAFLCDGWLADRPLRACVRGPGFEMLRRLGIALVPGARRAIGHVPERNAAVLRTLPEMEGAVVYLDSAKNNNRVFFFGRYGPDIDVRVIWLVRDGRGVVTSIMRQTDCDAATAARRWVKTQTSVLRTERTLDAQQVLHLRYEDLCTRPGEVLEKDCRFLGLDPAAMPAAFEAKGLHLTGNKMRLKGLGEIRIDERWKSALSEGDLAAFDRVGGGLNRELGYGVSPAPAKV